MSFFLYLPIAGISVSMPLLLGMGFTVGFLSGVFGVGGGFLLTPALIMIGIPPTVAAASVSNQIVAATTSGTLAHRRMGHVDLRMGALLLAGGLVGGALGVEIIRFLRRVGNADFLIKISYVVLLGMVGVYMFQESLRSLRGAWMRASPGREVRPGVIARLNTALPWQVRFPRSGVTLSGVLPVAIGFLVGTVSAIMGVGGGFLMVPLLVYLLRMPMHVVVGTNLFQELLLCMGITFLQADFNRTVDAVLALLLLAGSALGAQMGARLSTKFGADQLKILLACIILLTMAGMALDLLVRPDVLLSLRSAS